MQGFGWSVSSHDGYYNIQSSIAFLWPDKIEFSQMVWTALVTKIYIIRHTADSHFCRITGLEGPTEIVWGPGDLEDAEKWLTINKIKLKRWDSGNLLAYGSIGDDWSTKTYYLVKWYS